MAFAKKEWKNRLAEFAGRRRLINVDTGIETVVDVERDEGLVSQAGDAFSVENMNDLEQRIYDALEPQNITADSAKYADNAGHAQTAESATYAQTAESATYADSAGSVAYGNVTGRPTFSLSGSTLYINF